ncbi:MFS transporter [Phenylobacterium sp. J367]|uniref:spinster family MFS transporter n=1 Tax=Phenylobacterium sp. J367 TaxID=2898435 RepID=UPI002150F3C0|nr:MFS transporter [Phenylobacterium sp. J367]MCR5879189.1 MFS transporter [Phenylobacterium sp. J367]
MEAIRMTSTATPDAEPHVAPAAADAAPFSRGYTRYAMWLLLGIYVVNFLDRQVINILAEPIKEDLKLADWQLGLMSGLAFAVFYTVLGIPIARLAERSNRAVIIGVSVGVWSGFTALCATAGNFFQLVAYRIGVGVGEAGCTPPAHSLIVDYVPKEKRASALAFYSMGTPIGSLLGLLMGGIIADQYGWRTAFLVAGAPGLLFAVLAIFTLKEPRRIMARHAAQVAGNMATFGETVRYLATKNTFWFIAFAAAVKAFIGYGHAPFTASFFLRNHVAEIASLAEFWGNLLGLKLGPIGFLGPALGIITGVAGALGALDRRLDRRPLWPQRPTRLHGHSGHRQPGHHPDLHLRGHHRVGRARPLHARDQRLPGHALVWPGLRHRPVDRAAAHARHRRRAAAVHHQPDRPGPRSAGGGRRLRHDGQCLPGPRRSQRRRLQDRGRRGQGHLRLGRGRGRPLGPHPLRRLRHRRLRLLLDRAPHHPRGHGELRALRRGDHRATLPPPLNRA